MKSRKFRHAYSAIAAVAILGATAAAWAAGTGADSAAATNDAMAVANNKVSLTQAIATA